MHTMSASARACLPWPLPCHPNPLLNPHLTAPAPIAHLVQGGALLQRPRGCGLDDGAVSQGVRVGHAQLNHVSANLCVCVCKEQGAWG